ncbi:MAG: AtpZ/AtpI family protein [Flavobacteriales bacterium]|nr:AtpZ/AtpI family protein [Flavobacteriales bacterium]
MEDKKKTNKKYLNTYASLGGLVFQMAGIIGLSAYAGVWLDEKYEFDFLFTVVLSLIGVFISLYIAYKEVQNLDK